MSKTKILGNMKNSFPVGYFTPSGDFVQYTKPYLRYYPEWMDITSPVDHIAVASGAFERYQENPERFSKKIAPWDKRRPEQQVPVWTENMHGVKFEDTDIDYLNFQWTYKSTPKIIKDLLTKYFQTEGKERIDGKSIFSHEMLKSGEPGWMYTNQATFIAYKDRKDSTSEESENVLPDPISDTYYQGATFLRVNDDKVYIDQDSSPWTTVLRLVESKSELRKEGNDLFVLPERNAVDELDWTPNNPANVLQWMRKCEKLREQHRSDPLNIHRPTLSYIRVKGQGLVFQISKNVVMGWIKTKDPMISHWKNSGTGILRGLCERAEVPVPNKGEEWKSNFYLQIETRKIQGIGGTVTESCYVLYENKVVQDWCSFKINRPTLEGYWSYKIPYRNPMWIPTWNPESDYVNMASWNALLDIGSKIRTMLQGLTESGLTPLVYKVREENPECADPELEAAQKLMDTIDKMVESLPNPVGNGEAMDQLIQGVHKMADRVHKLIEYMLNYDPIEDAIKIGSKIRTAPIVVKMGKDQITFNQALVPALPYGGAEVNPELEKFNPEPINVDQFRKKESSMKTYIFHVNKDLVVTISAHSYKKALHLMEREHDFKFPHGMKCECI